MEGRYNTPIEELQEHLNHLEKQLGWHLNTEKGIEIEHSIEQYREAISLLR